MRRIRSREAQVLWLQGPGPCDLWTWLEGDQLREQELTFFGLTVVHKPSGLRTGVCHEGDASADMDQAGLLDFDTSPKEETLRAAHVLLAAVPKQARHPQLQQLQLEIERALNI